MGLSTFNGVFPVSIAQTKFLETRNVVQHKTTQMSSVRVFIVLSNNKCTVRLSLKNVTAHPLHWTHQRVFFRNWPIFISIFSMNKSLHKGHPFHLFHFSCVVATKATLRLPSINEKASLILTFCEMDYELTHTTGAQLLSAPEANVFVANIVANYAISLNSISTSATFRRGQPLAPVLMNFELIAFFVFV